MIDLMTHYGWIVLEYAALIGGLLLAIHLSIIGYKKFIHQYTEPWIRWGDQTARLLGWPMLLILITTCTTKLVFAGTCLSAGYQCQYAFGVSEMAQQYLTSLVGGESDVTVTPRTTH